MKIGYVRVSKYEQNEARQIDVLKEASCEKWFVNKITGSKAERKGLGEVLACLRPGAPSWPGNGIGPDAHETHTTVL